MRYAVISDIHANDSALHHVLIDAQAQGAERIVCLGDVVGYGPLPQEALARVRGTEALVLAGNHDDAVSGRQGADEFIDLAGEAVKRHHAALSASELDWLAALPYCGRFGEAVAAHGDFVEPKAFNYIETEEDAARNFRAFDGPLAFVGHTHHPELFVTGASGRTYRLGAQDFVLEAGKRYIVNPGSVGYPRECDGTCWSSYVLYDDATHTVTFRRLPFSVSSVMQRGKTPRRRLALLAGGGITAVAIGAALLFRPAARPADEAEIKAAAQELKAAECRSLRLAERTLPLALTDREVCANLRLGRGSDPIELRIVFRSGDGAVLREEHLLVRSSSSKRFRVPAGSTTASFAASRTEAGSEPRVTSFEPAVAGR